MKREVSLILIVSTGLFLAVSLSSALMTASDVMPSKMAIKDVDNDGIMDIMDAEGEVFLNNENNEFNGNGMNRIASTNGDYLIEIEDGVWVQNHSFSPPSNGISPKFANPLFAYNSFKFEAEKCVMMNNYNLTATIFKNHGSETYLPQRTISPFGDFNLFLHMHPEVDFDRVEDSG